MSGSAAQFATGPQPAAGPVPPTVDENTDTVAPTKVRGILRGASDAREDGSQRGCGLLSCPEKGCGTPYDPNMLVVDSRKRALVHAVKQSCGLPANDLRVLMGCIICKTRLQNPSTLPCGHDACLECLRMPISANNFDNTRRTATACKGKRSDGPALEASHPESRRRLLNEDPPPPSIGVWDLNNDGASAEAEKFLTDNPGFIEFAPKKGDRVEVDRRYARDGGVAFITAIDQMGERYSVRYVVGGTEKNIPRCALLLLDD